MDKEIVFHCQQAGLLSKSNKTALYGKIQSVFEHVFHQMLARYVFRDHKELHINDNFMEGEWYLNSDGPQNGTRFDSISHSSIFASKMDTGSFYALVYA